MSATVRCEAETILPAGTPDGTAEAWWGRYWKGVRLGAVADGGHVARPEGEESGPNGAHVAEVPGVRMSGDTI